jgi:hypothetical protein
LKKKKERKEDYRLTFVALTLIDKAASNALDLMDDGVS